jgi:predicted acyltransferase
MKNWKTTATGIALAVMSAFESYASNGGDLGDWKLWGRAVLIAALGYLAKDFNTTGKP